LTKAVSITLGPKGKNVVISKKFGSPQIINDGVAIAKEINLINKLENIGVCLLRQAASKTNTVVGDGTTTSTVIAHALIAQGLRNLAVGANPIKLKSGIEKSTQFVVNKINDYSRSIECISDIQNIATVAAGNDPEIGKIIAEAVKKVGREGLISIEEGYAMTTELEILEGMCLEHGFLSSYFITDKDRMEAILENPYILLTDTKIRSAKTELLPTLNIVSTLNRPLLIISDGMERGPLSTLITNKVRGIIQVAAIQSPGFGNRRAALLSDLAVLTGGQVIGAETGLTLATVELKYLGKARRAVVGKQKTNIISNFNKTAILTRCEQLKRNLETTDSTYEKQKLHERIANLSGGVAVIKVGASTSTELKDRKLRLEDAVNATKASVEEGIVPGGGAALAHIANDLALWVDHNLSEDEQLGGIMLSNTLSAPLKQIAINAGYNGHLIFDRVKKESFEIGYEVCSNNLKNMFDVGIIDAAKVTRLTVQNASSISCMILTTDCMIVF
jgi:chaperonin GroEL